MLHAVADLPDDRRQVVLLRFVLSGATGMFFVMALAGMVCTALSEKPAMRAAMPNTTNPRWLTLE